MIWFNPDRKRWEATVWDQNRGPEEKKLNAGVLNTLKVYDRYEEVALEAKIVYIDERQVIFLADKKYYRLRCGETVYPANREPLSESELKELGIGESGYGTLRTCPMSGQGGLKSIPTSRLILCSDSAD